MKRMDWLPIEAVCTNKALRVDLARAFVSVHPLVTAKQCTYLTGEAEMLSPMSASADIEVRSSQLLPVPSDFDPLLQRHNPQVDMVGDNGGQHNLSIHHRKTNKIDHLTDKLLDKMPWQRLKDQILAKFSTLPNVPVGGSRSAINSGVGAFTSSEQLGLLSSRNQDDKYSQRLLSLENKSPLSNYSSIGTSSAKKFEVTLYHFCALCGNVSCY